MQWNSVIQTVITPFSLLIEINMAKTSILIIDKKDANGVFRCEEKIKLPQFQSGVDYIFNENEDKYTIFSSGLIKDILLIQNPYSDIENRDVSDLELRVLVDYREEINVKPQIVMDLEKREGSEVWIKGRNDSPSMIKGGESSSRIQAVNWDEARENKVIDTEMPDYSDVKVVDSSQISKNDSRISYPKTISSVVFTSIIMLFYLFL